MTWNIGAIRHSSGGPIFLHDSTLLDLADGVPFQIAPNGIPNQDCTEYGFDEGVASSQRPTFRLAQMNGLPALDYDGSNDVSYLYGNEFGEINVSANPFGFPQSYPLLVVAAVVVDAYSDACIAGQASADPGIFGAWHTGLGLRSDGRLRAAITYSGGTIAEGGTVPLGVPTILTAVLKQGATAARIDGVEVATSSATTTPYPYTWGTLGASSPNGTSIGTRHPLNGRIGELRIYRGQTADAFVEQVETELATKWGA